MISPENPLGLKGIHHLEFTVDNLDGTTCQLFKKLGFVTAAKSKHSVHLKQNRINFLLVDQTKPELQSSKYYQSHGEGVSKMAFSVDNAEQSLELALKRGAKIYSDLEKHETEEGVFQYGSIKGFGDVINEFVQAPKNTIRHNCKNLLTFEDMEKNVSTLSSPCLTIDHLTNNVPKGEMDHWVNFYEQVYGFKVTRYFDIKGLKTGLLSKVVQSPSCNIIIPINEPEVEDGKSQIQEFLDLHKGPGVQHIAFTTNNILKTVSELKDKEIKFLEVPDTYYEMLPERNFSIKEDIKDLQELKVLADGDDKGYLLQIFTDTYIGPTFFEYITRRNHLGFGEGNFQALFDSIERDQIKRGYLQS